MAKTKRPDIVGGDIKQVLIQMTVPMILGILGIVAFNLADTYFVGRLGTVQLAAISFTFPVVLVLNSLNQGIGIGTSSVISNAVGRQDETLVKRLATDSLLLGLVIAVIAAVVGELTIEPLFRLLGADDQVMPFLVQYMRIWYAGSFFLVIPMIGNSVIRALGDTKTPSMVMLVAASANIVLDPILIFGFGPFEGYGVSGAALATVISRFITFAVAMYLLIIREKILSLKKTRFSEIIQSWKAILFIGLPNALARMILPVGTGIITGLISKLGYDAVAGYGIATRLEFLFFAVLMALSAIIPIFVGQNYGAGQIERIRIGIAKSEKFSIIYGLGICVILYIIARPLAGLFSDNQQVIDVVVSYFRFVPIGYGFYGVILLLNSSYNALKRPIKASLINIVQVLGIYVPMAILTVNIFGVKGIFASLAFSYILVGVGFHIIWKKDSVKLTPASK